MPETPRSGRLPRMEGDWDELFDETYLSTYGPLFDEERTRREAEGAARLAGVDQGAEILDCPCGFARHSLVLTELGYRVTGADRSEAQLAEARRRIGEADWPRLVRADYRELPFEDAAFDAVLCLFTSLGYLDRTGDVQVLSEFRRVLRPDCPLVVETMHRDRLARIFLPRTWERLPDGGLFVQERRADWVAGTLATEHVLVTGSGERVTRQFVHRGYTATEWAAMLAEGGFADVECFGGWDDEPLSPDTRLVIRGR